MVDILLDEETNDIAIESGDLVIIGLKQLEALQAITITLRTNRGEWFRNINYGVPWLSNENNSVQLLGSKDKTLVDSYIKKAILGVDVVLEILEFNSTQNVITGLLTVSGTVLVEGGAVDFEVEDL